MFGCVVACGTGVFAAFGGFLVYTSVFCYMFHVIISAYDIGVSSYGCRVDVGAGGCVVGESPNGCCFGARANGCGVGAGVICCGVQELVEFTSLGEHLVDSKS